MRALPSFSIRLKIISLVTLMVGAVIGIGWLGASEVERGLLNQKYAELKSQVDVALSVIDHELARSKTEQIDPAQAKRNAAEAVRPMRFSGQEYFYIYDMSGINRMHPFRRDFEGKDMSQLKDENGTLIIRGFIDVIKAKGTGSFDYLWKKPGTQEATLKIGYVTAIKGTDWFVGTGVHIEDVLTTIDNSRRRLIEFSLAATSLMIVLGIVWALSIGRPLKRLERSVGQLAEGNLDHEVDGSQRGDELGAIARAVSRVRDLMRERADSETHNALAAEKSLALQRKDAMAGASQHFDKTIQSLAEKLQTEAVTLSTTAEALSEESRRVDNRAATVSDTIGNVHDQIRTVASAIVELDVTTRDTSGRCRNALAMMASAASSTEQTRQSIQMLNRASEDIGEVAALIQSIAEQTNLLALNATIEAARAGEAGKGFAVVASEVKQLATQTASATGEISRKISAITTATREAVQATDAIGLTIGDLNMITGEIATTVEQQASAAAEISQAVAIAAAQTEKVAHDMTGMVGSAETTLSGANAVVSAAHAFGKQADEMRDEARKFTAFLAAA